MKRVFVLWLLLSALFLIAACGGKTDDTQTKNPMDTDNAGGAVDTSPNVPEQKLSSVELITEPDRTAYYYGDTLDTGGLSLQLIYDNGETEIVTEGFTCSANQLNGDKVNGMQTRTVTVDYMGMSAGEFDVSVVDGVELVSIDFVEDRTENRMELLTEVSYYVVFDASDYADEEITIPSVYQGVAVKAVHSFHNNTVKKIVLDEGFETIMLRAFESSELVEEIVIPASVSQIDRMAVLLCSNLKKLTVDKNSEFFVSDDVGVVYTKDMKVLVVAPQMMCVTNGYVVPEGVIEIAPCAFYNAAYIGDLVLPKTLQKIGESAFRWCRSLNTVIIPENVAEVGKYAFMSYKNDFPDEIHCQSVKKPDGWDDEWIEKKYEPFVTWNSRYVDWETLTLK